MNQRSAFPEVDGPVLEFAASPDLSVGLELEFQLLDRRSHDLADAILPLLETYRDHPEIKPELFQSTVEVASRPAADLSGLRSGLLPLLRELLDHCQALDLAVCGAGTHPFHRRPVVLTPGQRYAAEEQASGWLAHHQVTFATHIHLGMPSAAEAITLMRELRLYLPVLIALSASSPFWQGSDTRFAAFRHRVLASARTYGLPPEFSDWAAFSRGFRALERAGLIQSIRDLHWDIRPHHDFGTLEMRVCDAQPSLERALALAALLRSLARALRLSRREPATDRSATDRSAAGGSAADRLAAGGWLQPLPWWLLKDNCFAASRYGIDARLMVDETGTVVPLRRLALETLERAGAAALAEERSGLALLRREILEDDLPYQRQRRWRAAGLSLPDLVAALIRELRDELQHRDISPQGCPAVP